MHGGVGTYCVWLRNSFVSKLRFIERGHRNTGTQRLPDGQDFNDWIVKNTPRNTEIVVSVVTLLLNCSCTGPSFCGMSQCFWLLCACITGSEMCYSKHRTDLLHLSDYKERRRQEAQRQGTQQQEIRKAHTTMRKAAQQHRPLHANMHANMASSSFTSQHSITHKHTHTRYSPSILDKFTNRAAMTSG